MFGDNDIMINSSSYPYARLHKRHSILAFHFVRGFIALHHLRSANNNADILTKLCSKNSVYQLMKPIFHHVGNTASLYHDESPGCLDSHMVVVNDPQVFTQIVIGI